MSVDRPPSTSPSANSSTSPSRCSPSSAVPCSVAVSVGQPAPSTSSIVVAVRKRPKLPSREQDENDVVRCSDDGSTVVVYEPRTKLDLTPVIEPSSFSFDHVYSELSTNEEVYRDCCQSLLANVRDGGGAVVFAFGQTGSGKTYTMLGDGDTPGLYGLAVTELVEMKGGNRGLSASFYEVYGTKLYDLLNDRAEVKMLQDEYRNIHIVGLTERDVTGVSDVNALISSGQQLRAIGTTHANDRSSRSHAVLEIKVKPLASGGRSTSLPAPGVNMDTYGRITFVDLAGSERASDTAETDVKTRREGAEINKSLLALKECIRAMSMRKRHIPFRGSKLTQILRESFTGRCRTCIIATISPCQSHCEDSLNTLRYADRIKELKGPAGGGAGMAGLQVPTPCHNCGLPIFVGDRHVCRRQLAECPHCREVMDRGVLEAHLTECKEVPLRCPFCNERMLRADLPRHNRRCFRLPVRCTGCGQQVPRNQMERHVVSECGGAKEKCPHCLLSFPRQALPRHEKACDAARVACPHCLKQVRQRRLEAHVALCFMNPNRAATTAVGGRHAGVTGAAPPPPPPGPRLSAAAASPSPRPAIADAASPTPAADAPLPGTRSPHPSSRPLPVAKHTPREAPPPASSDGESSVGARFPSVPQSRKQTLPQRGPDGGEYQTSCSLEGAVCPYARYGCPAKVSRANLPAHLAECVQEHLRLVTLYADSVDAQNAELRRMVVSERK